MTWLPRCFFLHCGCRFIKLLAFDSRVFQRSRNSSARNWSKSKKAPVLYKTRRNWEIERIWTVNGDWIHIGIQGCSQANQAANLTTRTNRFVPSSWWETIEDWGLRFCIWQMFDVEWCPAMDWKHEEKWTEWKSYTSYIELQQFQTWSRCIRVWLPLV